MRNVGSEGTEESVRTARPNAGINGQELRGDRGGRADVMGAGAATLEPKVPRPLPPTPATRLEGGFEWEKTEKVERVKVEEKKTRMSTREYFATDDRHQTAGVRPQGHQVSQELDDSQQTATADTHDEDLSNGEPQLFLLSADSISGADAVSLAKTLNANIFQAAAFIADSLECTPAENNARKQLYLGECIAKRLASADPAIVQIALQAAIARWCKRKIDSWCLGDERFGENLCKLYEKVLHTGKWPVLCFKRHL